MKMSCKVVKTCGIGGVLIASVDNGMLHGARGTAGYGMITGELKSKVDQLWTAFWSNGISNPLSVIEQISYLLFLKRLDDRELLRERRARRSGQVLKDPLFPPNRQLSRWSQFKNIDDAQELLIHVRDEAFPFVKEVGAQLGDDRGETTYAKFLKDAVFLIVSPGLLKTAIKTIEELLTDIDRQSQETGEAYVDLMGDLYEYMLGKLSTAGQNGQFRTPRHIIRLMVELMEPGPREVVCDPACGTAGFLVGVADYLRDRKDADGNYVLNAPGNREHFNRGMFHGFDFDATMLRIGSMNLLLHGIENPQIESRDALSQDHAAMDEAFTLILANPPFKGSIDSLNIAADLTKVVKTKKTELLFLALFLRLLKVGGRCAAIVPDGVLFGSSKAHQTIRKTLVDDHKLDGIISMPSGVFKPYAGVSTAIVLFTKTGAGGTDSVWFYDMQADGFSLDDKRQPIAEDDIPDLLMAWRSRGGSSPSGAGESGRGGKAFFVPKAEIVANGYDLSINRYKEVAYEAVSYDPPLEILAKLRSLENDIRRDLDEIEALL